MSLANPRRTLGRFLLLSTSPTLLTMCDILLFFTNSFWLASLLALLVRLSLSFLIGALRGLSKSPRGPPFDFVEVFCKDWFLTLCFSFISFHQEYSSVFVFLRQLLSLCRQSGHLVLLPFGPCCDGDYSRSSDSTEALVGVLVSSSQSEQI